MQLIQMFLLIERRSYTRERERERERERPQHRVSDRAITNEPPTVSPNARGLTTYTMHPHVRVCTVVGVSRHPSVYPPTPTHPLTYLSRNMYPTPSPPLPRDTQLAMSVHA